MNTAGSTVFVFNMDYYGEVDSDSRVFSTRERAEKVALERLWGLLRDEDLITDEIKQKTFKELEGFLQQQEIWCEIEEVVVE